MIDLDGPSIVAGGGAYTIWSPHGTYVAYTGGGLWIRNLATGTVRRLTRRIGAQIAWSPDGKWIAGGMRTSVALVRARDGSQLTRLPASDISGGAPSFSHGLVVYAHTGECGIDIAREKTARTRAGSHEPADPTAGRLLLRLGPPRTPTDHPIRLGDDRVIRGPRELSSLALLLRPSLRVDRVLLVRHRVLPLARKPELRTLQLPTLLGLHQQSPPFDWLKWRFPPCTAS